MKKMRNKKLDELISEIEDMQNDVDAISYEELWSYKSIDKDLEILDLFKKYFSGVLQEESGRLFIDMNELEEGDLAVFLKLFKEQVEEQE